jgi:anti-sigma regulatory factor (Ser/Thr protein kinase)
MSLCDISHLEYSVAIEQLTATITDSDHISCQIDFEADHSNSKVIRDFIGSIFDLHQVEGPWKGRFILITDELINNAIEHGSQPGDIDSCVIEAHIGPTHAFTISLEVHDTGRGKDAKDATHMETIRDARLSSEDTENGVYMEKRGRGLFYITEKLVDRLSFASSPRGGLAVKIEKSIEKPSNT